MRNDSCPAVAWCKDAKVNDCDGCAIGKKICELEDDNKALREVIGTVKLIADEALRKTEGTA